MRCMIAFALIAMLAIASVSAQSSNSTESSSAGSSASSSAAGSSGSSSSSAAPAAGSSSSSSSATPVVPVSSSSSSATPVVPASSSSSVPTNGTVATNTYRYTVAVVGNDSATWAYTFTPVVTVPVTPANAGNNPTFSFTAPIKVVFDTSALTAAHPFWITLASQAKATTGATTGGITYTSGHFGAGTSTTADFSLATIATSGSFQYYCSIHNFGGVINVAGSAASLSSSLLIVAFAVLGGFFSKSL